MHAPLAPAPAWILPLGSLMLAAAALAGAFGAAPGPGSGSLGAGEEDRARFPEHALRQIEGLVAPAALAFAPDGTLLVCETGADRVTRLGIDGDVLGHIGGPGSLRLPAGIAVHPDGRLVVADTGAHRLVVYSAAGDELDVLGGPGVAPGRFHDPAGLAIDAAGERLAVCDRGNRRVQVLDLAGTALFVVGGAGSEVELLRPAACAFAGDGSLVVVDRDSHRVRVFDEHGALVGQWGDWGAHPGLFAAPVGLAVRAEHVFVAEEETHRVQVFDLAGSVLATFGTHALRPGEGDGKLHYPSSLSLSADGELLALTEPLDDRVQIFARERTRPPDPLPPMPGVPQPPAHYGPEVSAGGPLLAIAEPETRTVLVFDDVEPVPRMIARVGRSGRAPGQFSRPTGLHLDEQRAELFVSDPALRRVSHFRLRGHPQEDVRFDPLFWAFVKSIDLAVLFELEGEAAGLAAPPEPGALVAGPGSELYVADLRNDCVLVLTAGFELARVIGGRGSAPGELRGPAGLALSADGERLYVSESIGARVQVFSRAGEPLDVLGGEDPAARLSLPHGVAVDALGRVLVSDAGAHRLFVFGEEGELIAAFGSRGLGRKQLAQPRGVTIDGAGRVVVLEHANHRGQRFDAELEYAGVFGSRLYSRPARLEGREQGAVR